MLWPFCITIKIELAFETLISVCRLRMDEKNINNKHYTPLKDIKI